MADNEKRNKANPVTITIDIRPEIQAELARQAAACGRALETHAAKLLEEAVHVPTTAEASSTKRQTGQSLVDAFAEIRGLLTDEEVDQLFARNTSTARPVDLS